jgi:hypothetical protein
MKVQMEEFKKYFDRLRTWVCTECGEGARGLYTSKCMVCKEIICKSCTSNGTRHQCCREPNCATCIHREKAEKEEEAAIVAAKTAVVDAKTAVKAAVAAAAESKERFARAHLKKQSK